MINTHAATQLDCGGPLKNWEKCSGKGGFRVIGGMAVQVHGDIHQWLQSLLTHW
jgi:hypothetical protein